MKKHFVIISSGIILWFLFLGGCERDRKLGPIELLVKNNYGNTIVASLQYNYPDTSLMNFIATPERDGATILPYSEVKFSAFEGWEKYIIDRNSNKTLIVVIYSSDTLKKYTFGQIQFDYNILKRYDLSVDHLKTLNWIITYP